MNKANRFGGFFKQRRMALGKTCGSSARKTGWIRATSVAGTGLLPAPQSHEILESYAGHLQLKKGSDSWYEFFDLAAAETGRIPQEILDDGVDGQATGAVPHAPGSEGAGRTTR